MIYGVVGVKRWANTSSAAVLHCQDEFQNRMQILHRSCSLGLKGCCKEWQGLV